MSEILYRRTDLSDGGTLYSPVVQSESFWVTWPVEQTEAPRITDAFGTPRDYGKHEGIDCDGYINASGKLADVLAAQDGIVEYAVMRVDNPSYGYHIVIRHPWNGEVDRWRTLYGHLSYIGVKRGDVVKRGDKIGTTGRTGTSAIHLHFNVHDALQGLKGFVRCRDCSGLWPDGVIDPQTVMRLHA